MSKLLVKSNKNRENKLLAYIMGHSMTILPAVFGPALHSFPKKRQPISMEYVDDEGRQVNIFGDLYQASIDRASTEQASQKLRILIPGLSSSHRSPYLAKHIQQALLSGNDVLSLAMRGVLGKGRDLHHAGFTEDLHYIFNNSEFAQYEEITLMGFSMGGLVVLNFARECTDKRLKAVATLCAPLQLSKVQKHLDKPAQAIYRKLLFRSLKTAYQQVWNNALASPYPLKSDLGKVLASKTFAEWDQNVVISRFPFTSIEEYHQQVSISHQDLESLSCPSYLLFNQADPMVRIKDIGVTAGPMNEHCIIHFAAKGGHLGFNPRVDLGFKSKLGVSTQLNSWFEQVI